MVNITEPTKAKEYFQDKMQFSTGPVELSKLIESGENINVIDVRAAEDYLKGHLPGAINLPRDKWQSLEGLQKDSINVLYCYSGVCHLAANAGVEFAGKGFPVMEMDGGFNSWKEHNLKIEQ